jgi:uncharacterized protein
MRNFNSLITVFVLGFSSIAASGCATSGADEDVSEVDGEAGTSGKFAMWQAGDGWHFHLKSGNGSILLSSEAYSSRTAAINGVLSVQTNGVDPAQYAVNQTATGWNLHLSAANHESIAFSQVYKTKSSATRAITSSVKAVTTYLDKRESTTTGARVDVSEGESGKFHFNFFARNGQIVLSSESYETNAAAFNGAFAVQTEGVNDAAYTIKQNASGGFYFTVTAQNGQIIGMSQQYTTKQSAADGAAALKALLPSITVL